MSIVNWCDVGKGSGGDYFFSSRRRHTRLTCDWSSDVCSSDLARACGHFRPAVLVDRLLEICRNFENLAEATHAARALAALGGEAWLRLQEVAYNRSEERRVGKEGRSR